VLNRLESASAGGSTAGYNYDLFGRLDTRHLRHPGAADQHLRRVRQHHLPRPGNAAGGLDTTSYTYDPLGRQVSRTTPAGVTTQYAYLGLSSQPVSETGPAGQPSRTYDYTPAGMRLSQTTTPSGGTSITGYYSYNGHADVEAVTGASGTTTSTYGYTAYGDPVTGMFTGNDKNTATPARISSVSSPTGVFQYFGSFSGPWPFRMTMQARVCVTDVAHVVRAARGGTAVRVSDIEDSVYDGLRALDWRRYLCAMWILCGELRVLYEGWLEDAERSLMASTLEIVRDVVIVGEVTTDMAWAAAKLSARWQAWRRTALRLPWVSSGQWNAWVVFADLTAEIAGTCMRYEATERLDSAATERWREFQGRARFIDPDEEIDDASPMAQTLSLFQRVVAGVSHMPESEWDPVKVHARLLG
jgi:hypothetical protein